MKNSRLSELFSGIILICITAGLFVFFTPNSTFAEIDRRNIESSRYFWGNCDEGSVVNTWWEIRDFDKDGNLVTLTRQRCDGSIERDDYGMIGDPIGGGQIGQVPSSSIITSTEYYNIVGPDQVIHYWKVTAYDPSHQVVYYVERTDTTIIVTYVIVQPKIQPITASIGNDDPNKPNIDLKSFNVYPNPSKNIVTISFKDGEKLNFTHSDIAITSYDGKVVIFQKNIDFTKNHDYVLDVSNLPPGTYFVNISEDGKGGIGGPKFIKE